MKFRAVLVLSLIFSFQFLFIESALSQQDSGVIKVEMKEENGKWQLYRGGEPYYINGVGGGLYMDRAVAYGANSVRTWGVGEAISVLDEAHEKGLSVLFGLWVGVERQGFDYDDTKAVQSQLDRFTEVVKQYKNHPAILAWGIGNEADLFYADFKVWNAIEDIAAMIKREDPNHPTMTVTAGLDIAEVQLIMERAPSIDIYGINTYGDLLGSGEVLRKAGWTKPYVIAEWGPNGHWEVAKTEWQAPVEQTSTEKALSYRLRYNEGIRQDEEMCVGSYVFLWGQKQETTPTWYGLFLEDGTETQVMDELEYAWTGSYPENQGPAIESYTINGEDMYSSLYLDPGRYYNVSIKASDPNNDELTYKWELLPESTDIKSGGDKESRPEAVEIKFKGESNAGDMTFKAPTKEGPYRLFVYIYDGKGKAATANFPFYAKRSL